MRKTVLALALTLLAPAAIAQSGAQPAPGERVIIVPPAGWQAVPVTTKGPVVVSQLFPPGQSAKNYVEAITLRRDASANALSPKEFVAGLVQAARNGCEGSQVGDLDESPINGYPAAGVRLACTKGQQTGKSGLMLIVAIRGKDALYTVQRMWLGQPVAPTQPVPVPKAVLADWAAFTRTILVCDSRTAEHPCPSEKK